METITKIITNNHYLLPEKEKQQIIYLTRSKSAWLTITWLTEALMEYSKKNFHHLFEMHPAQRGNVILYGNEVSTQRWYKSYLQTPVRSEAYTNRSYMYADKMNYSETILPSSFQPYLEEINKNENEDKYNQVIVNWYANGNDYIAAHSDCQLFMKPNASIAILSLYNKEENFRILQFTPKKNAAIENDFIYHKLKIAALQGCIITMHGDTQQKFRHKIPKDVAIATSRISITFRKF